MRRSDPATGLGKPEQLRHKLAGFWSKHIFPKDRLIYKFDDRYIYVFALGGHYDQH
jgi:toxin YoeB